MKVATPVAIVRPESVALPETPVVRFFTFSVVVVCMLID